MDQQAKRYSFVNNKFRSYQIAFSEFKEGTNTGFTKIAPVPSAELVINTKKGSIGQSFAHYSGSKAVNISGFKPFSKSGIYLITNYKIIAEVKAKNPDSIDWEKFRKTAGVDLIIQGKKNAYLGSKKDVSINDILDLTFFTSTEDKISLLIGDYLSSNGCSNF